MTTPGPASRRSRSMLVERWQATTPVESAPPSASLEADASPRGEGITLTPEEHLAAIEAAVAGAVPRGVLATFLSPVREALAAPPEERDPEALTAALDRLEDVLEAFLLVTGAAPASGPSP